MSVRLATTMATPPWAPWMGSAFTDSQFSTPSGWCTPITTSRTGSPVASARCTGCSAGSMAAPSSRMPLHRPAPSAARASSRSAAALRSMMRPSPSSTSRPLVTALKIDARRALESRSALSARRRAVMSVSIAGVAAAVGVDGGGRQQAPQLAAVGAEEAHISLAGLAVGVALAVLAQQRAAGLVHELAHRPAQHLLDGVAQHARHGRVDEGGALV